MRRSRAKNLSELILSAFGGTIGTAVTLVLMLCLLAAAYSPLSGFIQVLHGLFFNGIGYGKLAMYVLPTVLFVAWLGFETIGRTAKCFALLLLIVLAVSILTASSEFETYRLYPFPGSNIGLLTRQAFSQSGAAEAVPLTKTALHWKPKGIAENRFSNAAEFGILYNCNIKWELEKSECSWTRKRN